MKQKSIYILSLLTTLCLFYGTSCSSGNESNKNVEDEYPTYNINKAVVDNEYCKVTVKEIVYTYVITVNVVLENKIEDKSVNFFLDNPYMNGYNLNGSRLFTTLEANSNKEEEFKIYPDSGVGNNIDELMFTVSMSDPETYSDIMIEKVSLYPTGLTKDSVIYPNRITTKTEKVIVDNEYCSFVILSSDKDKNGNINFEYYYENKTDNENESMFYIKNLVLNDTPATDFSSNVSVIGHKRGYSFFQISKSEMDKLGITELKQIAFGVNLYQSHTVDDNEIVCSFAGTYSL